MSKMNSPRLKKQASKTGRKGGQFGNSNAAKFGAFMQAPLKRIDKRTREGKTIQAARSALTDALGGDPTPQQAILIERLVFKMIKCALYERATLNGQTNGGSDHIYLAWSNSLRLDLQALGITRKPNEVCDLRTYLTKAANQSQENE